MGPRIRSRYPVKDPVRFHDRHSSRWDEDVPRTTGARWTEMADNERGRGPSIVAPYTYHGDCLCWLMATYVAHTSHYEAVLDPHEPLLSPWPRRRRVMANTLRIKCILSLSAWWHRCHSTIQITLTLPIPPCGSSFYPFLPSPLFACLLPRLFSSLYFFSHRTPVNSRRLRHFPRISDDASWRTCRTRGAKSVASSDYPIQEGETFLAFFNSLWFEWKFKITSEWKQKCLVRYHNINDD